MMKKMISCMLGVSMLCSAASGLCVTAKAADIVFKHQNVVNESQTCYKDDQEEKEVTADNLADILSVKQGMRINQPVFRAEGLTANKSYTVKQELKDGTVIRTDEAASNGSGTLEFKHARNCEMIEILDGDTVTASLGTEPEYIHGVEITRAPMAWQVYQRDENNEAEITIKGLLENGTENVTVEIDGAAEAVNAENNAFTYTKTLSVGTYDITVKSEGETVAEYENVAVGDIWVAAGQSNMTDMGAITDGFTPDTEDPINDNMHIIFPEDCTWQKMEHPAGEGRFFKTGVRTSPVTSFAREIASSEDVPVGIVQSSVGGTNVYQWVKGVRDSDPNSGYLIAALKSCFDKMPSHNVKGILWYQGCNDADNDNYAYNYQSLQQKVFDEMRAFFGADTTIITTQLNDYNNGSHQAGWSFIKDIQRRNEELYDNVYVVGTGELELGDTVHNNAASNVILGRKWANAARNVVYGDSSVSFRQPTIDTARVTGSHEITLTFKNSNGLKKTEKTQKRIGITNGGAPIALGDLTKEFTVRQGGDGVITSAGNKKGMTLTVSDAEIIEKNSVKLTTEETLSGTIAVDCMYGNRFTPTLVDAKTNESVLSFYNVIAEYDTYMEADKEKITLHAGEAVTDADLIIASYKSGALLGAQTRPITLAADEDKEISYTAENGADTVKAFLWDGLDTMVPLSGSASVDMLASDPTPTPSPTPIPENPTYTFGDAYNEIKAFTQSGLDETAIGKTGFKISTVSSNYNNVVVRDKSSDNSGYYPYGNGLPENGYYLFLGSGGNGGVSMTLTLPAEVKAGQYMKITYAKPYATNNGSANRNSANDMDDKITVGSEVIDLKENCEFDKWYTTTVKLSSAVTKLDITLGRWGAAAISKIEITDSADTMELAAENNVTEKYITSENQTVKYTATVYNSITTEMGKSEITARGAADMAANVTYSVNGYTGVSIAADGTLTITPSAQPGTVKISASYGAVTKTAELTLLAVGDADGVKIAGEELVNKGGTLTLKAIPTAQGTVIPERETKWTIEGENHGCTVEDGVLTVPAAATAGNITVKATLAVTGAQTSENVSDTFTVTIRDETDISPYTIGGVFLKNCASDMETARGVDGVIIDKSADAGAGYNLVVKATDNNGITIQSSKTALDTLPEGVSEAAAKLDDCGGAVSVKAYIVNSSDEIVSDEIYKTAKTSYKNVPLVADWITGAKSGLGMGAGIMAPQGAPYGVDPETVDVKDLNISYTYDNDYKGAETDNVLWYKTGAYAAGNSSNGNSIYSRDGVDWEQQALPIGNGYMGGMLFGLPDKDQIQFNEETFWAAGYRGVQTAVNSDTVNKNMSEGINGYMSAGNIFVDFGMPKGAAVNNYYRDLNLDEAVAHVRYEYDGVKYSREYFASHPKGVLAFRYNADTEGALNFTVNPVSMHPGEVTVNDGEITIIGKLKDSEPYNSGGNAAWNQESDLEYCTKIKVIADGGEITDGYNKVTVNGATDVTILVTAATDYDKDQFEIKSDGTVNMAKTPYKSARGVQAAIDKATERMNGAAAMDYDALKQEHIADYKSQFDTVKFSLTGDAVYDKPTDELQRSYKSIVNAAADSSAPTDNNAGNNDEKTRGTISYNPSAYNALDKHLEELHFNYARYMMISSSRSDTMPATLQGKWCQSTAEIWGSCYCININMEMNYWFAGGANLLDSGKALIGWFNSQIPAGRVTAKNMYRVTPKSYKFENGQMTFADSTEDKDDVFIMHTKQAIMGTTDLTGGTNIQSAGNTAWLAYNLWDLYQTSGDTELLKNDLYPIMRKMANFYTQYLYNNEKKTTADTAKYPDGYYYTTWAGRSPEHGPTHEGIKYDLQLVAGMYDYTIAAAKLLGEDPDKVTAWEEIRNHLEKPVEIGETDGEIKEWAEETGYGHNGSEQLGGLYHRHISHLVGLYPGTLISSDEEIEGAKKVLQSRGDSSTGWSCSNKFLLWARCLDGDKALELFRYQLAQKTYANLFDTHAPFQIDGNFGSAAGVMELLMQSQTGVINVLPALPKVWDKGEISGIKAKNGATVSIKWSDNKADEIRITPAFDGDLTIGYDKDNALTLDGAGVTFTDGKYTITEAKANTEYVFISK